MITNSNRATAGQLGVSNLSDIQLAERIKQIEEETSHLEDELAFTQNELNTLYAAQDARKTQSLATTKLAGGRQ
ncbi:hypothetical protein [Neopusillimonas maritima]|uniref:Uncharacterized protein n=1 Tax=Neopusillimonas maritima TaxID=2026239 RepID=A0A3A1YWA5_9BURK|nr:hypothetical protein [Neopusillimonas maritima]RIY41140.1 hypothetical protein CJP73_08320 [Neopusillimonas maritima]